MLNVRNSGAGLELRVARMRTQCEGSEVKRALEMDKLRPELRFKHADAPLVERSNLRKSRSFERKKGNTMSWLNSSQKSDSYSTNVSGCNPAQVCNNNIPATC